MSRFRLEPTAEQEAAMASHCAHARFIWNLAVEQDRHWRPGRASAPNHVEQCRQLTEARGENAWLAEGSQTVQQQALRDFAEAKANYFKGTHRRPGWRRAHRDEGFRIVGAQARRVERLSRGTGRLWIPKAGWVRFRWSREIPEAKSYRVTKDRRGRWHVAFAVPPKPIPGPGNGRSVGVDRGVIVSAALSTGELLIVPGLRPKEEERLVRLHHRLGKAEKGSHRREILRAQIAALTGRATDRRKNWVEQTSTTLARNFDLIGLERLDVKALTRSARGTRDAPGSNVKAKARLNRGILAAGWGQLAQRLEDKAPGRVTLVDPAYTSQRCSACGEVDRSSRESQALFRCTFCGHALHADVNAARNIRSSAISAAEDCDTAAGRAVAARGGGPLGQPRKREPHLLLTSSSR